jgi:cytochrome b561
MTGNTSQRWGSVQIGLHWTIAGLLLIQVPVGFGMLGQSPGPTQNFLFNLHKNLGLIVFALAIVRLAWRLRHPVPYLPAGLPAWQASAAHATHWLLYFVLFAMPLTGFLYTALSGYPVPLLMAVDLAKLLPVNKPLGETFKLAHLSLQWLLYLAVAVHVGAAFQHHLVRKDWVLRRMMSSTEPLEDAPGEVAAPS